MPSVGDGTGNGSKPESQQGLTSNQGKKPQTVSSPYGSGDGGVGPEMASPGNRTAPQSPGK